MNHPGGWFKERVVVVTGAGSGIGQATTLTFAEQGATVFALDISLDRLRATRDLLAANGLRAHSLQCDVGDPASITKAVTTVTNMAGSPRILVNCAGTWPQDDIVNISAEASLRVVKVNQLGPHWMAQATWQHMASAGGGVIVNIGSIQSNSTYVQPNLYSATKAALVGLTKSQAVRGRLDNIRSVCISPGVVATNMANWEQMPPDFVNAWRTTIPS
jgi:NAD(P)-dependent dehydrogenase (short-subunit alcohol dehydrogenase family)